jgi:myosin-7
MIPLPVAFMDGTVKEIEVDAQVTGKEIRSIIAKKIGLVDQFGFSIFCAIENNVCRILWDTCIRRFYFAMTN